MSFFKAQREKNKAQQDSLFEKYEGNRKLFFTDPSLNWCTGGLARGRCNLIYGPRGSGKTALAFIAAGIEQQSVLEAMRRKDIPLFSSDGTPRGMVIIFDSEGYVTDHGEVDPETQKPTQAAKSAAERLARAGLDPERVIVAGGKRVGELFGHLSLLVKTLKEDKFAVSSIIVDSWGGIQNEQTVGKIEGNKVSEAADNYGGNAKTIGVFVQYLLDIAIKFGVTNLWVQHCMQNLKSEFPKWILLGGQKLQFEVHSVLFVESAEGKDSHLLQGDIASVSHNDAAYKVGKKIYAQCIKSRFIPEGRKGEFYMNFTTLQFAIPEFSLLNLAKKLDLIHTAGSWHSYPKNVPSPAKFQGDSKFIDALKSDKNLYNTLVEDCMSFTGTDATGGVRFGTDDGIDGGDK